MGPPAKGFLFVGGPSSMTRRGLVAELHPACPSFPLICVAVAIVLFILWGSEVIRAIRILLAASVAVGRGEYRVQLPVERRDEFGELYRGFTRMAEQLEENLARLEESKRLLVTSEKMAAVGRFSAGVAHEINNPLGIILNHVQLLRSGRLEEKEREEFLARMETEIKRVNRLLRNLLHHATDEELAFTDLAAGARGGRGGAAVHPEAPVEGRAGGGGPLPGRARWWRVTRMRSSRSSSTSCTTPSRPSTTTTAVVRIDARADGAGCCVRVTDNGVGMDETTRGVDLPALRHAQAGLRHRAGARPRARRS